MIGLRLTIVGSPSGRVSSQTARIIGRGPMAMTSSNSTPSVRNCCSPCVTSPCIPYEPSSVVTM